MDARARARVTLIVGLVAAGLYLPWLGQLPLLDASEGFHVAITREMGQGGDWLTPHFDGVRYFDKPLVGPCGILQRSQRSRLNRGASPRAARLPQGLVRQRPGRRR